jgi:HSP20 family protein
MANEQQEQATGKEEQPAAQREQGAMAGRQDRQRGRGLQRYRAGPWMSPFEEMDRLFGRLFPRGLMRSMRPGWPALSELSPYEIRMPRVDVVDKEEDVLIRAEIPGVKKEDLDVSVTDHTVIIRGEAQQESAEEEGEYYLREMSYGAFSRSIPLPADVDTEKCRVSFKDGILEMKLPKAESAKRRRIPIEEG